MIRQELVPLYHARIFPPRLYLKPDRKKMMEGDAFKINDIWIHREKTEIMNNHKKGKVA